MAAEEEVYAGAFDGDDDDDLNDTDADDDDLSATAGARPPPQNPNPIPSPSSDPMADAKCPRIEERRPPPSSSIDESRRLFQRIWTDEEEIKILRRFLEFTSSRGTTFASHQYDTGPFYEQIKCELQLDFNKNQLVEKLRRLKKKYRTTANRMSNQGNDFAFKNPHEKAVYEIAKNIWSASFKRSGDSDDDLNLNPCLDNKASSNSSRSRRRNRKRSLETLPPALPPPPPPPPEDVVKVEVQNVPMTTTAPSMTPPIQKPLKLNSSSSATPSIPFIMEDTVKSCISPIFKELLNSGLMMNFPPPLLNLGDLATDERWKKQQILELEVYLTRVELIRDQIKSTLDELKGSQSQ